MSRRTLAFRWLKTAFMTFAAGALLAKGAGAAELLARAEPDPQAETHKQFRASADKGLAFLASRQKQDGSFPVARPGTGVAVTALAGLAMLETGSTREQGPFQKNIDRAAGHLLASAGPSGVISDGAAFGGPMYGHGLATLMLAECYRVSEKKDDLKAGLKKAVALIASTQSPAGGWRYQPIAAAGEDMSVTGCQLLALDAARRAGIEIAPVTLDRLAVYLAASQNPDGGFRYVVAGGASGFSRSAAGVSGLYLVGKDDTDPFRRGLDYLARNDPGPGEGDKAFYLYGAFHAANALRRAGGAHWRDGYLLWGRRLVNQQQEDGSWVSPLGPEYATAMACVVLLMPELPAGLPAKP